MTIKKHGGIFGRNPTFNNVTISNKTTTDALDLAAIAESKSETAVDVFVYDTSKDSDGGAWRHRTQNTSWYNETLNTATRGSRKEFPAVAVIVAETDTVTIYDGDDPDLPMWMVFVSDTAGEGWLRYANVRTSGTYLSSLSAINGVVSFGINGTYGDIMRINFISDMGKNYYGVASRIFSTGIDGRNTSYSTGEADYSDAIVNRVVNDVAMTVLPNAPIDPATGIQIPTIAVATNGGVSVIKDDGTVVDITYTAKSVINSIDFDADNNIVFVNGIGGTSYQYAARKYAIPAADISEGDGAAASANDIRLFMPTTGISASSDVLQYLGNTTAISRVVEDVAIGSSHSTNGGLTHLAENAVTPSKGMVAYTTSDYNTGWMNGDIKGAFLASTDNTSLVGATLLDDDFTSDIDGWTGLNSATLSNPSGKLRITSGGSGYGSASFALTGLEVGARYQFRATPSNPATLYATRLVIDVDELLSAPHTANSTALANTNERFLDFVATATTHYAILQIFTGTASAAMDFDNVSVKLADEDRSVNANGLAINGTVTRSAVATGAELVAYSGFSTSNYLEQPYNSDLDFGTGDFCIMGWLKNSVNATRSILSRGDVTGSGAKILLRNTGGGLEFYANTALANAASTSVIPVNSWLFFVAKKESGVLSISLDGRSPTNTSSVSVNLDNTNAILRIGERVDVTNPWEFGSLALIRISATAPSPEQIQKIYNDEKWLFQENADCTLYGSSDAVTALAYDDSTNLLHVGTSAGRSVFQGLRRIDNTTTAVGTAISASNGMVADE